MKYSPDSQKLASIPFEYNVSTSVSVEELQLNPLTLSSGTGNYYVLPSPDHSYVNLFKFVQRGL